MIATAVSQSPTKSDLREQMQALIKRRISLGMSMVDLCRAAELHPSQLSRYERGHLVPSARMLERIAKALNVLDLNDLESYAQLDIDRIRQERQERIWSFLERIYIQRFRIGMTRNEFARRTGLNGLRMARYETRKTPPTIATLKRMAEVVGLELPEELLEDTNVD